jgi:REP-associated tyrosine transposase
MLPAGAVAHITNRGAGGEAIFRSDGDRQLFLWLVAQEVLRRRWSCHAFCLMDNHYHLLLQAPEGDLSTGMRTIGLAYARMFNKLYERTGHLFQGRFRAALVEHEAHGIELARYIALNPVRAGLVARPDQWRWSSYSASISGLWLPDGLHSDWFLRQFGSGEAMRRYVERDL